MDEQPTDRLHIYTHLPGFNKRSTETHYPTWGVSGSNNSYIHLNPKSAKFMKIHLEMEWVDLWQLL